MADALMQFAVLTASTAATMSAGYVAKSARKIVATIEKNEQRSKRNQRTLDGTDHHPGVVDRVERLEDTGETAA